MAFGDEDEAAFGDRASALLGRVSEGVFVTDARGRVTDWNATAARLAGAAGRDLRGLECQAAFGLHDEEARSGCAMGCLLLARGDGSGECSVDTANGTESMKAQAVAVSAAAVVDERGDVVEVVHVLRDATRAAQAEEAKRLFLATASHQLRTPITVIGGFAETLLASPDADASTRGVALQAIHQRSAQLTRFVDRLLLSSRIEVGRVDVRIGAFDVAAIVRDSALAADQSTGQRLVVHGADGPRQAEGDSEAFAAVLDHLLDNALKYSRPEEPVTIAVTGDRGSTQVAVTDRGIGMRTFERERCFDRFWQGESMEVRRFGGTGIGLYIVKALVDAMGGTIGVESDPGRGTTFVVGLTASAADDDSISLTDADSGTDTEPSRGGRTGEWEAVGRVLGELGVRTER